jgi:hypothetical protein
VTKRMMHAAICIIAVCSMQPSLCHHCKLLTTYTAPTFFIIFCLSRFLLFIIFCLSRFLLVVISLMFCILHTGSLRVCCAAGGLQAFCTMLASRSHLLTAALPGVEPRPPELAVLFFASDGCNEECGKTLQKKFINNLSMLTHIAVH